MLAFDTHVALPPRVMAKASLAFLPSQTGRPLSKPISFGAGQRTLVGDRKPDLKVLPLCERREAAHTLRRARPRGSGALAGLALAGLRCQAPPPPPGHARRLRSRGALALRLSCQAPPPPRDARLGVRKAQAACVRVRTTAATMFAFPQRK